MCTEEYRSGHNEPHSKCGVPYGTVGSNPTSSAKDIPLRMLDVQHRAVFDFMEL